MPTLVDLTCKHCGNSFSVKYKERNKRKFCSRQCVNKFQTGAGNPAFGKTYRTKVTHPEWAARTAQTHRTRGHITGDKNPMRNSETAAKMSASRSTRFRTDEAFRKQTSESMRKAWRDGKFEGTRVGKCKWYDFTRSDGTACKLQGTWELAYAKWLDNHGIRFLAHRGRIPYTDDHSVVKSYYPDFYLPDADMYVDVKNEFHFLLNEEKWEWIRKSNPDIKIVLLFKEDLQKLGVI